MKWSRKRRGKSTKSGPLLIFTAQGQKELPIPSVKGRWVSAHGTIALSSFFYTLALLNSTCVRNGIGFSVKSSHPDL